MLLLPVRDYLTVQLVRLVTSLGQRCCVARQSRSWGKKRTTGRPRIDDELTSASGLMGLETRSGGGWNRVALLCVTVWESNDGEDDTERR
jgi:hypothetical protein